MARHPALLARCTALLLWGLPGLAWASLALEGSATDVNCNPGRCEERYAISDPLLTRLAAQISAGQSSAASSGDLATGQLAALAQAAPFLGLPVVDPLGNLAIAQVVLGETVHVQGTVLSPVTGYLVARVLGQLTRGFEPGAFVGNSARGELAIGINDGSGVQQFGDVLGCELDGAACKALSLIDRQFTAPFQITPGQTDIHFDIRLTAIATNGGIADFSHTSFLALALPAGLSFTSDSGVFLSQAVPEPAGASLWLLGLGLLAGAFGRRQPTQASAASHSGAVNTKPSVDSTMDVVASASKLR